MMRTPAPLLPVTTRFLALFCVLTLMPGCALLKRRAVGMVASTLASSGDIFTRDDDLELVGDAIPFGLKLYESLLDSAPRNKDLLVATCSNFTQYGVAYLETEAALPAPIGVTGWGLPPHGYPHLPSSITRAASSNPSPNVK